MYWIKTCTKDEKGNIEELLFEYFEIIGVNVNVRQRVVKTPEEFAEWYSNKNNRLL